MRRGERRTGCAVPSPRPREPITPRASRYAASAPLEGHVSSQDHIIRGAARRGRICGRESNETRHGSLLRETSHARSWRDSFQG